MFHSYLAFSPQSVENTELETVYHLEQKQIFPKLIGNENTENDLGLVNIFHFFVSIFIIMVCKIIYILKNKN